MKQTNEIDYQRWNWQSEQSYNYSKNWICSLKSPEKRYSGLMLSLVKSNNFKRIPIVYNLFQKTAEN